MDDLEKSQRATTAILDVLVSMGMLAEADDKFFQDSDNFELLAKVVREEWHRKND